MKYLLDTDIVVYYLRGHQRITERLAIINPEEIAIASVTLYELMVGVLKLAYSVQRTQYLEEFLNRVVVLPIDKSAAREAAQVRAELEKQGTPIGSIDYLIAGVALSREIVLVTHNQREFARVPRLVIEDWF